MIEYRNIIQVKKYNLCYNKHLKPTSEPASKQVVAVYFVSIWQVRSESSQNIQFESCLTEWQILQTRKTRRAKELSFKLCLTRLKFMRKVMFHFFFFVCKYSRQAQTAVTKQLSVLIYYRMPVPIVSYFQLCPSMAGLIFPLGLHP